MPLRVISPLLVFGVAAIGYLILWVIAPLDFQYQGGTGPFLLLMLYALLFASGLWLGWRRWGSATVKVLLETEALRQIGRLVALGGGIGFALRIFERVVLRAGGDVSTDFVLNRDLVATGGNGPLAFMGSALGSLLMLLPCFVFLARAAGDRRRLDYAYIALGLAYPVFDLLLQGSRSTFVIFLGLIWASAHVTRSFRIGLKAVICGGLIVIGVAWGAGYIFWIRTSEMGLDPVSSTFKSGYALFAPPNNLIITQLRSGGISGIGGLLYGYVHFSQYMLHGVYEFLYAASHITSSTTRGIQSFYIPVKAIGSVFGITKPEILIEQGVIRSGVYTSLFGPMLYDFGRWGGAIAALLFGFFSGVISRAVRRGQTRWLPLYVVIIGLLPYAFVVNWFTSGNGQYLLLGALSLYCALRTGRLRIEAISRQPEKHVAKRTRAGSRSL